MSVYDICFRVTDYRRYRPEGDVFCSLLALLIFLGFPNCAFEAKLRCSNIYIHIYKRYCIVSGHSEFEIHQIEVYWHDSGSSRGTIIRPFE